MKRDRYKKMYWEPCAWAFKAPKRTSPKKPQFSTTNLRFNRINHLSHKIEGMKGGKKKYSFFSFHRTGPTTSIKKISKLLIMSQQHFPKNPVTMIYIFCNNSPFPISFSPFDRIYSQILRNKQILNMPMEAQDAKDI